MRTLTRNHLAVAAATALAAVGLASGQAATAFADDTCAELKTPVLSTVNPKLSAQLLTVWSGESAASIVRFGFTDNQGVLGYASNVQRAETVPVYRLYNTDTIDFVWATEKEVAGFEAAGYNQAGGANFFASNSPRSCTVPIHRLTKGTHTRNETRGELSTLTAQGWIDEGAIFHLADSSPTNAPSPVPHPTPPAPTPTPTQAPAPPSGDATFGLAVIPDTQAEVNNPANTPFLNRVEWLASNQARFKLEYALHTGDVTNWGWLDAAQFARAKAAMKVLSDAGIPYSLTIGNHDTAVVGWDGIEGSTGYGGAAYMDNPECPQRLGAAACKSWLLIRNTDAFNKEFPVSALKNLGGTFEAGRVDNNWTTFTVKQSKWMVLTLELSPRESVVNWAENVVRQHPDHNVIIQTHHYLDGNGTVSGSNNGYGARTPRFIYDRIVSTYSNVKLIFSGHTGGFTKRTDTNNGNTVVSYLGNDFGGPANNPVRVLSIDTETGQVDSTVYNPIKGTVLGTTSDKIDVIQG